MIQNLLKLAQQLDDFGETKVAQKIDALILKLADDDDEDRIWNKKPKDRPGSNPVNWFGLSPIEEAEPFNLDQLPDSMRPKPQQEDEMEIAWEREPEDETIPDFEIGQMANFQHNLDSDKKFLLEDIAEEISTKLEKRPTSILNKTDLIQPYIRLEFGTAGAVVLSAHSAVPSYDESELQVWLEANSFFNGKTNQLKFPLDMALGGGVDQATIETMVERIVSKIESLQNN